MKILKLLSLSAMAMSLTFCVSNKELAKIQEQHNDALDKCVLQLDATKEKLAVAEDANEKLKLEAAKLPFKDEKIESLQEQLADAKQQRDKQLTQVEGLTQVSQSANENIKETLTQLETKDSYIRMLQAAKNRADSINLALAVNLKGVLQEGIQDEDVEIKVDKTVVFINLSDKMLYQSGSATITPRAGEVLGKIAQIVKSKPDLEVMVEGYTDSDPISNDCIEDNWDLSVKRSTAVVRALQEDYGVDPNRLIAAGRGEFNKMASNDTEAGKAANRRTRIIIMPKLNQFYDLLDPSKVKAEAKIKQ